MKIPEINHELAEFVGILLGDGCIIFKEKKHYEVKISLDKIKDKEYVNYVKNLIYNLFQISAKEYPRSFDGTVDIRISNKELVKYLINDLGMKISPKMNNAIIPKNIFQQQFFPDLLRGYFDTDGCMTITNNNGTKYPRIEMKICKSPMQKQFIAMLKSLNFRFGAYNIDNEAIRIQINGKNELKKME